ncbi:GNAT family N-acetyltransferase [Frankia sp. AgB1.9]|uniref:GNAT family N-acetyltransferase n=1 Tax=unclassified Frankia TaxID=2632575 RepID=UPI00193313F7|nr:MULTISPECIES: GNAT family N-acetyltransferase [unclassified Frankia]MBL7490912.1 GNAT family N-acetyltransferase [Frankia sp. AgW1.1]MBL7548352.1 GNAT family N-acetyltransferase [Frankia sp. AgB1.9]MBL7619060.1 GNAT family N-acetyltransferase [Frankia sp. AgB1.8]
MPALEPVEITAGSLHLRPWRPQDADDVFTACQDPDIQRWTMVPSPYTQADAVTFVERVAPIGWATGTAAQLAVVDATTGGLLASISLQDMRDADGILGVAPGGTAEVGYWCAAEARGRGVTTNAVRALCRWGFGALKLTTIRWLALVGNEPSRTVAQRAGFTVAAEPRPLLNPRAGEIAEFWTGILRR